MTIRGPRAATIVGGVASLACEDRDVVEGRWEASPAAMATAMDEFNAVLDELADTHDGEREQEHREVDNFVLAFADGSGVSPVTDTEGKARDRTLTPRASGREPEDLLSRP